MPEVWKERVRGGEGIGPFPMRTLHARIAEHIASKRSARSSSSAQVLKFHPVGDAKPLNNLQGLKF